MRFIGAPSCGLLIMVALAIGASAGVAVAQTDEIQVYDAGHAGPGVFNLTWHNNFTPDGVDTPAFPGAVVADKSFNGVAEWAYGITPWFEQGLYLPLYSVDKNLGPTFDGFKIRELFTVPDADKRRFVFGVNFEFSVNSKHWDQSRVTSEVRSIVGWHFKPWDLIVNPIFDTEYDGLKNLDFASQTRLAYNLSSTWAIAAEEYADLGRLRAEPARAQSHQLYAVIDRTGHGLDVECGVGFGLTNASDRLTLKLLLSRDLNGRHKARNPRLSQSPARAVPALADQSCQREPTSPHLE